jgi:hypothetical protein
LSEKLLSWTDGEGYSDRPLLILDSLYQEHYRLAFLNSEGVELRLSLIEYLQAQRGRKAR